MTLKTRKPTGVVPYPVVLLEGQEKAGKSYAAALLSTSQKVGQTFWIDLGEGAADEYGAIPDTRYVVVEHDGTYAEVLQAIVDVKAEAAKVKAAGGPPVVLVIDSMTALWEGLKDWASQRAKGQTANRKKLADDPAAEVNVSMNLWNDAGSRYRRVMTHLLTFPGIVVLTARGKEVAEMKEGRPVEGSKDYRVEGHKSLAYDATVWVRMTRTSPPLVIGARSVHAGLVPGKDEPQPIGVDTPILLEWLIFEAMKVDADKAEVRDLRHVVGGELTEDERVSEEGGPPKTPKRAARQQSADPVVNGTEDPWAAVPVAKIPVVTDAVWAKDFRLRVAGCSQMGALRGLYGELKGQVMAGQVEDADGADLAALLKEQVEDIERIASTELAS